METLLMISQGNINTFWVLTHISAPSLRHSDSSRPDCGHRIGCTQLVLTADKGQLKPAGCVFTSLVQGVIKKLFSQNRFHFALITVNLTDAVRLKEISKEHKMYHWQASFHVTIPQVCAVINI